MGDNTGRNGGGPRPPRSNCDSLTDRTPLNSVDFALLAHVAKGDVLEIAVKRTNSAKIVVALHKGKVLGSITSVIVSKLLECIDNGHDYVADVLSKTASSCTVLIHHK